jgi:hypothetical protein
VQRIGSRLAIVVPAGTKARRIFEVTGIASEAFVFESLDEALAKDSESGVAHCRKSL